MNLQHSHAVSDHRTALLLYRYLDWGSLSRSLSQSDQIVVVYGCPLPLVVRRRKDRAYRLIGPCYVHGMMKGEAMEEREEIGLQGIDFVFK